MIDLKFNYALILYLFIYRAFTGKYPPKMNTASKYERRVDRRTYGDKMGLFNGVIYPEN